MKPKLFITNPFFGPQEGFGEQYKMVIYYAVFAELYGFSFVYTPFKEIAHNYSKDPNWVQHLEKMVHLEHVFDWIVPEKHPLVNLFVADVLFKIQQRIKDFETSSTLKNIRNAFYEQNLKNNPYPYPKNLKDNTHVALHIRRQNGEDHYSHSGLSVPDEIYEEIISALSTITESKTVQFHLFSQGDESTFERYRRFEEKNIQNIQNIKNINIVLHLNTPLEETFTRMVFADILVVSPSALSYTAGLLSTGRVYYLRHCNPPLPSWFIIQGYISPRLYHKFSYQTTVYFDSEKGEYIIRKDGFPFGPLRIV
jgi:hypothetical protein